VLPIVVWIRWRMYLCSNKDPWVTYLFVCVINTRYKHIMCVGNKWWSSNNNKQLSPPWTRKDFRESWEILIVLSPEQHSLAIVHCGWWWWWWWLATQHLSFACSIWSGEEMKCFVCGFKLQPTQRGSTWTWILSDAVYYLVIQTRGCCVIAYTRVCIRSVSFKKTLEMGMMRCLRFTKENKWLTNLS